MTNRRRGLIAATALVGVAAVTAGAWWAGREPQWDGAALRSAVAEVTDNLNKGPHPYVLNYGDAIEHRVGDTGRGPDDEVFVVRVDAPHDTSREDARAPHLYQVSTEDARVCLRVTRTDPRPSARYTGLSARTAPCPG
ncbi:hypothetical protein ACSMX9_16720 [Streptomyces sp. LE64]|jgi:hypothetical protein|uniref:hypothetical protein n=1 Tax=Streptomyces sp. LE64 TaxID=3448653 RepID=UPI00404214B8